MNEEAASRRLASHVSFSERFRYSMRDCDNLQRDQGRMVKMIHVKALSMLVRRLFIEFQESTVYSLSGYGMRANVH